jgi:hypothetical protein
LSGGYLLAASLAFSPTFSVTARDTLLANVNSETTPRGFYHANYDISPDGQSLVVVRGERVNPLVVVIHEWTYELRERLKRVAGR